MIRFLRLNKGNNLRVSGDYKFKRILLIGITVCSLLHTGTIKGQCDSDPFLDSCASNLGTYNYIRSFAVYTSPRRKTKQQFSYVFSSGSTYKIIGCKENMSKGTMIITLYDRDHNLLASSFDEKEGKNYSELKYLCSSTGLYYIKVVLEGIRSGCGLCILGFNKD